MKLTRTHRHIALALVAAALAATALAPVETLVALGAILGAAALYRWPQYGVALLVTGTVTNAFGVASNVHGLPGIQTPLTVALAAILMIRWIVGKEDLTAGFRFVPLLVCVFSISLLSLIHIEDFEPTFERLSEHARDLATAAVVIAYLTSRNRLGTTIRTTVLAMGAIALLSVKQYLSGSFDNSAFGFAQAAINQIAGEVHQWRISGTLPDANYYGQILVMTLPLACGLAFIEKNPVVRLLFALCALAILAATLFTFSRGAILAIAAMVVAGILTLRARWQLLGVACLLAVVGIAAMPSSFLARIELIVQAIQIQMTGDQAISDPSLSGRIAVMGTALRMFWDHPMVGIGLGQYTGHYSQYALASGIDPGAAPNPHSLYLEALAEEGVFGIFKLLTVIVVALMIGIRGAKLLYAKNQTRDAALATSLCLSFIGYLATAVFLHGAFLRFFWIEIALVLSLWRISIVATPRENPIRAKKEWSPTMMQRALSSAEVLGIIRERKYLIGAVTAAFMLVPMLQEQQSSAESTLLYRFGREYFPVRPGEEHRNWGENVQVSLDAALFTEMHLLRSREVIESTVAEIGLDKLKDTKESALSGVQAQAMRVLKSVFTLGGLLDFGKADAPSKRAVDPTVAAAKDLADRLRIRRVEGAAMIAVGIQDPNPELAEKIITAHVDSYLRKRQQLFERDPSKFYSTEIAKAQIELNSISEKMNSLRLQQGVPDESVEHSVLSDRLIALERQRESMRQAEIPVLQKDLKDTREALFGLNALTATTKLLEARYRSVAENLERMLQEQNRWRLDSAYVRELGPTIEIVEPAAFSARPAGLPRVARMTLGGVIGFVLINALLIGLATLGRKKRPSVQPLQTEPPRVKVYSNS
ncbi:O-antigen ligase family protein [Microvirga sp. 2MCAF35]|uniref:O-antigen ligase family protein n=1 Tax=Microvirga sp. 2MCAF35 TaxID=3232987 RepID=UPI003F995B61